MSNKRPPVFTTQQASLLAGALEANSAHCSRWCLLQWFPSFTEIGQIWHMHKLHWSKGDHNNYAKTAIPGIQLFAPFTLACPQSHIFHCDFEAWPIRLYILFTKVTPNKVVQAPFQSHCDFKVDLNVCSWKEWAATYYATCPKLHDNLHKLWIETLIETL